MRLAENRKENQMNKLKKRICNFCGKEFEYYTRGQHLYCFRPECVKKRLAYKKRKDNQHRIDLANKERELCKIMPEDNDLILPCKLQEKTPTEIRRFFEKGKIVFSDTYYLARRDKKWEQR